MQRRAWCTKCSWHSALRTEHSALALDTCSTTAAGFAGKKAQAYSIKSHWSMMRLTLAKSGLAAISLAVGAWAARQTNPTDLPLSKPALMSPKALSGAHSSSVQSLGLGG